MNAYKSNCQVKHYKSTNEFKRQLTSLKQFNLFHHCVPEELRLTFHILFVILIVHDNLRYQKGRNVILGKEGDSKHLRF